MRLLARLRATVVRAVDRNLDLLGLWFVMLLGQHFVPVGNLMARNDLLPWTMVALSAVAVLRGRPLGAGPHPRLTRRTTAFSRYTFMAMLAVVPWTLLTLHDAAASWLIKDVGLAMGLMVITAILLGLSSSHNRTAWNPPAGWYRGVFLWIFVALVLISGVVGAGVLRHFGGDEVWARAVSAAVVLGASFLSVGLIGGRPRNQRQRVVAGRKDGTRHTRTLFPSFLATFGPSIGLGVLFFVLPDLDFSFAFVASLLVIVWGAVIWPPEDPVAVACLLHEVIPIGGNDSPNEASAKPFHLPPEGALRFNPLRIKRTMVAHTWYVPVRASRIADLDDPVRPLWPDPVTPPGHHVLGDALFEPDPLTKGPQWDVVTIRIKSQEDTSSLKKGGDGKTRRMVILRAFTDGMLFRRSMLRTYTWDQSIPEEAVQVLDATTPTATLKSGDLIVLSSEGVAHAYEFEVGGPIYWEKSSLGARPPQLPDYVKS